MIPDEFGTGYVKGSDIKLVGLVLGGLDPRIISFLASGDNG